MMEKPTRHGRLASGKFVRGGVQRWIDATTVNQTAPPVQAAPGEGPKNRRPTQRRPPKNLRIKTASRSGTSEGVAFNVREPVRFIESDHFELIRVLEFKKKK